jgi:hypothetical protein
MDGSIIENNESYYLYEGGCFQNKEVRIAKRTIVY